MLKSVDWPNTKILHQKAGTLAVLGIVCFLLGSGYRIVHANVPDTVSVNPVAIATVPSQISIPSIAIQANIAPGGIADNTWILNDTAAFYLPSSGKLNEGFNTVIYAHKLPNLFGDLHKVQIGDIIEIKDEPGTTFRYQIFDKQVINPQDVEKIKSSIPNALTLFTCDGIADTERLVVQASLLQ